ncbi:MAG: MFS transporter [Anaerolineae bacterium]|nr:MFS transporter [Anaerolineae bacterium]
MEKPSSTGFVRDRFTWLAYAMLAYFSYLQALLGPAMPFLRDDLDISYSVGGLHFSALALGMVMSGLIADRAVKTWGRRFVFWAGGAGMAGGGLVVAFGQRAAITIVGAWIMGFMGTFLLAMIQSTLSDHHGDRRAFALTESNVAASLCAGLSPLAVGGFQRAGIGWRGALYAGVLAWGIGLLWGRGESFPASPPPARPAAARRGGTLPPVFWLYWGALVLGVAAEWSVVSWGAEFMIEAGDVGKSDASILMTLYFAAMVTGRWVGSRLTRLTDTSRLILAACSTALVGFALFWLTPVLVIRVAGLFVIGLGIANLFPFLLSVAVGAAADRPDIASARITLAAGLAILIAPQILGTVADQTGIQDAYGLVGVLLLLTAATSAFANRRAARHNGMGVTQTNR